MENPLRKHIEVIKTGSRAEVREAQKQVARYWHDVYIPHREDGRKAFLIFLDEIKRIKEIRDVDHQAYLINVLKWPLWVIGEEYFETWADFMLMYIQHPSGKIRQAVIHAAEYLTLDIAVDLKYASDNGRKLTEELEQRVEKNKNRFCHFALFAEKLSVKHFEPRFYRCKYVNSLPTGVYKSLEMLLTRSILRSEYYENLYKRFLDKHDDRVCVQLHNQARFTHGTVPSTRRRTKRLLARDEI